MNFTDYETFPSLETSSTSANKNRETAPWWRSVLSGANVRTAGAFETRIGLLDHTRAVLNHAVILLSG